MDFKKSKLTLVVVEDDEQVTFFPYLGLIQPSVLCAQAVRTQGRLSTLLAQAAFLLPRMVTNIMHANFQSFCFCI